MPQMTGTPNRLIQVNCDLNKTLISMCYTSQRRTPSPASAPRKGRCRERDVQQANSDQERLNELFNVRRASVFAVFTLLCPDRRLQAVFAHDPAQPGA